MTRAIARRLDLLRTYVAFLRERQGTELATLRSDAERAAAIERYLQKSLEACLDIAERIVALEGLPRPESYRDAVLALGKAGILEPGFAARFARAAGFRNVLVHAYAELLPEKVHEALGWLDDFDEFARGVAAYLGKRRG